MMADPERTGKEDGGGGTVGPHGTWRAGVGGQFGVRNGDGAGPMLV